MPPDEAELAAAAFLSRYQGRTLDAYRYDLQNLGFEPGNRTLRLRHDAQRLDRRTAYRWVRSIAKARCLRCRGVVAGR